MFMVTTVATKSQQGRLSRTAPWLTLSSLSMVTVMLSSSSQLFQVSKQKWTKQTAEVINGVKSLLNRHVILLQSLFTAELHFLQSCSWLEERAAGQLIPQNWKINK